MSFSSIIKNKIVLLSLLIAVVGTVFIVGKLSVDSQAAAYSNAVNVYNNQKSQLLDTAKSIEFSKKIVIGRTETEAELTAVQQECDEIKTTVNISEKLTSPPLLASNPLSFISPMYQEATKVNVEPYEAQTLKQDSNTLLKACRDYVKDVTIAINTDKFDEQRKALMTEPFTLNCPGPVGCVKREDAAEFKKYYEEEVVFMQQQKEALEKHCTFNEMQKACDILLDYFKHELELTKTYYNALPDGDYSAAAFAARDHPFPTDALCAEIRNITKDNSIQDSCYTMAVIYFAKQYENKIVQAATTQ